MLNDYFKATFTTTQHNSKDSGPLYRYLVIPIIMSEKIEDAMDIYINDNKSYLSNSVQNLNNELLPVIKNLGPSSLRYQKLNLCINILFNKFKVEQELHLQSFLEDLITIGYKQIYTAIKNITPNKNYLDEFYKCTQKFKMYDTEDETFYFSNILLYVGSKYKYLEVPFLKEVYIALARVSEDWFEARENPTLKIIANNPQYDTLTNFSTLATGDKTQLINSVFLSENCLHFFACIHKSAYVEHTKNNLNAFKERIFANRNSVQARTFINYIFNFEKNIDVKPEKDAANPIDQFIYQEYVIQILLNSDLEALLNNTFLTQQDLNQLYLLQIVKGNVHANQSLNDVLNTKFKHYIYKDINLIRVDLLRNIIYLCQILQQKNLEEKYLKLLVHSNYKFQYDR